MVWYDLLWFDALWCYMPWLHNSMCAIPLVRDIVYYVTWSYHMLHYQILAYVQLFNTTLHNKVLHYHIQGSTII